ncbi:hypothetical protein KRX19_02315 [Cardiobacteriaceae bacterium TAE3-ERU3]|nr:hypothetical protein [Cardiobacteriaceae bacterium TAE3-ERU3]
MHYSLALSSELPDKSLLDEFKNIALVRGEYICRKHGVYVTTATWRLHAKAYLSTLLDRADGKAVWYRFTELETFEANVLAGCDKEIDSEANPVIGLRGVRRARALPAAFQQEIELIVALREKYPNLHVIIPFVTNPDDIHFVRDALLTAGYDGKIAAMIETPAALFQVEACIAAGLSRVVVGLNDLCSTLLASNRSGHKDDYLHPVVITALEQICHAAEQANIEVAVAGYLPDGLITKLQALAVDDVILHYALLPKYNVAYEGRVDSDLLLNIKRQTRRQIAGRLQRVAPYARSRMQGWAIPMDDATPAIALLHQIASGFSVYGRNPLSKQEKAALEWTKWQAQMAFIRQSMICHGEAISSQECLDYEQHRQQIEREFAARFAAQDALLFHSAAEAMSATCTALSSQGKKIVIVKDGLHTTWANNIAADYCDKAELLAALERDQPHVVLLQDKVENISELCAAFPATLFIVNGDVLHENVIGISGFEGFLPEQQAGVIYGNAILLQSIRDHARESGQLISDAVLPYFSEPLIRTAKLQEEIQEGNAAALHDALQQHLPKVFHVTRNGTILTISHQNNDAQALHALQLTWQSAYQQSSRDCSSTTHYPYTYLSIEKNDNPDPMLSLHILVGLEPKNILLDLSKSISE